MTVKSVKPLPAESAKLMQYLGSLAASLSSVCLGMALGWTSATESIESGGVLGFPVSQEEWSWVGSMISLGAVIGSPPTGYIVASLGRRISILLLVPVLMAGWILIVWAKSVWMLILGRTILGMATGSACISVPIYVCEIAESKIRGTLGSYFEFLMCIGVTITYLLGVWVPLYWLNMICLFSPLVFGVTYVWFPDSPYWLISRDRKEDARKSLLFYRGPNYDIDAELEELEQEHIAVMSEQTSFLEVFQTKAARRGLFLSVGVMIFSQITGINVVVFYSTTIFKHAGSSMDAYQASVLVGCAQVVGSYTGALTIDRLGRRMLLLISAGMMGVSSAALGAYMFCDKYLHEDVTKIGWIPVTAVVVYVYSFEVGYGPIPWLLSGEMFPERIKGAASSIGTISNWGCAFLVTKFFFNISESIGEYSTFWIFSGLCFISFAFIRYLLVETRGKTLEQIQDELSGRKPRVHGAHRSSIISAHSNTKPRFP